MRVTLGTRPLPTLAVALALALGALAAAVAAVPAHTHGERADDSLAELGMLHWRFQTGGPVRARPVLDRGVLFVGSSDHRLYALAADTGEERWSFATAAPVTAAPAVGSDAVYVADRSGAVYALDRSSAAVRWQIATGAELPLPWGMEGWDYGSASPVIAGSLLLVAAGDGFLRGIDRDTGQERWSYDTGARLRATPTVAGDRVFFGDGAGIIHALDLASGGGIWTFTTEGHALEAAEVGFDRRQIYSRVTVVDGVAYVGSRDAQIYALSADTGELLWKANDGTSAWVIAGPTVRDGRVYVTRSSSARVRALAAADGEEIWSVTTGDPIFGEAEVVGDTAYVANGRGLVLAVDAATGTERWRYSVGSAIWTAPLVREGHLYVGSDDGAVYAFGGRAEPTPHLAVFWDEALARTATLGSQIHHPAIRQYFEAREYTPIDGEHLAWFLSERIAEARPSVIVFATDELPAGVTTGGESSLLRRYLASGGRAVWLGLPPTIFERDAEGNVTAFDRQGPRALLGVDHSIYKTDRYGVFPTEAGRARGLASWWTGFAGIVPDDSTVVLARNEIGEATAWERSYGGGAGGGFVFLYPATGRSRLDEIRAVAEYGVFRSPAPPAGGSH